jgi:hypothetical protein
LRPPTDHAAAPSAEDGRSWHPDEGGDVDFAGAGRARTLDYPGLLSVEYFNLPDYGFPLDDPSATRVALAAHVRSN